jgi:CheY-like chemotaxis protein
MNSPVPTWTASAGRLLLAQSRDVVRAAVAEHFARRGWEVTVVSTGIEVITRGLAGPVDAVVVSVSLPELEGYEAAAILKRLDPALRIVLTEEAGDAAPPRARRRAARFRCFAMPLDLGALAQAIEEGRP